MSSNFIQELVEARFFRYQENFQGKKASDLATTLFLLLLLLEVLRKYDPSYAQRYAKETFTYGSFDGIRSYATDVHNLIAVLSDSKNQFKVVQDRSIFVPEFALKRHFRDVMYSTREFALNRSFFIQLASDLGVTDSAAMTARRTINDYVKVGPQAFRDAAERINLRLNDLAINCDIHWHYKTQVRSQVLSQ
jgi:hypothetical protein